MQPRNISTREWMTEAVKAHGGNLDFDTVVDFMIWLEDREGEFLKEEVRALFRQFLDSRKR